MPRHDIVVIGGSAGGLQALKTIVERLPRTLAAAVIVVLHSRSDGTGLLPEILGRLTALPVRWARHGERVRAGRMYVAPPDRHLLVERGRLRVVHGPRENGFRPAIDPAFRSAAREFGSRVIGVVLSGALSDGTYGLSVVKHYGGVAIVQDPAEAVIPSMPNNAIDAIDVDAVLPAAKIAERIAQLTLQPARGETGMARSNELEPQLRAEETAVAEMAARFGSPSALTCPDCGGALWEVHDGRVLRYICHVGHQYGPDSLEAEQRDTVDGALWSAVRVLEERAELKRRMARRAAASGMNSISEGFLDSAHDAHRQAQAIRHLLFGGGNGGPSPDPRDTGQSAKPRTRTVSQSRSRWRGRKVRRRKS